MKVLEYIAAGALVVMGLVVVFVQAGKTGVSGGTQAAQIINASGKNAGNVISALEGNG
jgi:hypothetical protein